MENLKGSSIPNLEHLTHIVRYNNLNHHAIGDYSVFAYSQSLHPVFNYEFFTFSYPRKPKQITDHYMDLEYWLKIDGKCEVMVCNPVPCLPPIWTGLSRKSNDLLIFDYSNEFMDMFIAKDAKPLQRSIEVLNLFIDGKLDDEVNELTNRLIKYA